MVCLIQEETVAGTMSLPKFFLKETKINCLPVCKSLVLSKQWHKARTGHKVLSSLRDLSIVGARVEITTGATEAGPSLANWFLDQKQEGNNETLDQSSRCLMFLCNQAWISLRLFPEPRARRKNVLKVRCLREAFRSGSKGGLVNWCNTRERFQLGTPLSPLGLSLW